MILSFLDGLSDNMFFFEAVENEFYSLFVGEFMYLSRSLEGLGERSEHLGRRALETEQIFIYIDLLS